MKQPSDEEIYEYLKSFLTEERAQKIELFADESSEFVLPVLEDIYQFRNAAAVLRSVEACGFHRVVALEEENIFNPNRKVTRGADAWMKVDKLSNDMDSLQKIKNEGYKILAVTKIPGAISLDDYEPTEPVALIFGNEMRGVSKETIAFADQTLFIPMYGFTESYNVSVAAAICMFELKRKLIQSGVDYRLSAEKKMTLKIRWALHSVRSGEEVLEYFLQNYQG